jgi:hypothetical protein
MKNENNAKILSVVEYDFLNPNWFSSKKKISPDIWLIGSIKPIYKNKGNPLDPKHFRPITILSCLGKPFTAILKSKKKACFKN